MLAAMGRIVAFVVIAAVIFFIGMSLGRRRGDK
jgi:hypothetical protein